MGIQINCGVQAIDENHVLEHGLQQPLHAFSLRMADFDMPVCTPTLFTVHVLGELRRNEQRHADGNFCYQRYWYSRCGNQVHRATAGNHDDGQSAHAAPGQTQHAGAKCLQVHAPGHLSPDFLTLMTTVGRMHCSRVPTAQLPMVPLLSWPTIMPA